MSHASTGQKRNDSRLSQRLRDARLHVLNLRSSKPSKGALVLRATESRSHGTLEVGNGGPDGRATFTAWFSGHGQRSQPSKNTFKTSHSGLVEKSENDKEERKEKRKKVKKEGR